MSRWFLVSNMCNCIMRGIRMRNVFVDVRYDKFCLSILLKMIEGGYINSLEFSHDNRKIRVFLRYSQSKISIIRNLKVLSTSTKVCNLKLKDLKIEVRDFDAIISTQEGVLFSHEAIIRNLGGILILIIE